MSVKWTFKALDDLQAVLQYIGRDDPEAASSVASRIRSHTEVLERFPKLGKPGRIQNTRELIVPDLPSILPYIVEEEQVIILRVLHQAMKWP